MKKYLAVLMTALTVFSYSINAFAQEALTKGEFAEILVNSAEDYNKNIKIEDIIKGDGVSDTSSKPLTKIEALVMLKRAFGNVPELRGDALRMAPEAAEYTDIPGWAASDVEALSKAGVISEPSGELGAGEIVTREYSDRMLARMYALYASNPKDDFYAWANRKFLLSDIRPGESSESMFGEMRNDVSYDLSEILADIIVKNHQSGSPEQKIKDFYLTATDRETREKLGITPIKPYLEKLYAVKTDEELMDFLLEFAQDTTVDLLAGFSIIEDVDGSGEYLPVFETYPATLDLSDYEENSNSLKALENYISEVLKLAGNSDAETSSKTYSIIEFEGELAKHSKSSEDFADINNSYKCYTLAQIQSLYKTLDLKKIAQTHGFNIKGEIAVEDPEAMMFLGTYFDNKHTQTLKNLAEISLISFYSDMLTEDFLKAGDKLTEAVYGFDPDNDIENDAFNVTVDIMSDYLGVIYYERTFDKEEEAKIRTMVDNIRDAYKTRISSSDMSGETKNNIIKKLDSMDTVIGSSDKSNSFMDNITIKGKKEGGTYIENTYSLLKAADKMIADIINGDASLDDVYFSSYTVNAMYLPLENKILLPAGILHEPMYDPDASYEENYAAIGYIIGHEMSHAFDTNGANYGIDGKSTQLWTAADREKYEKLAARTELYYDGAEAAAGLEVNGKLTLNENLADILGLRAALDALKTVDKDPDYKAFFEKYAHIMRYTTYRQVMDTTLKYDVHASGNVRINYSVRCMDEFYDAYGVAEGDGMYLPEDSRIVIE